MPRLQIVTVVVWLGLLLTAAPTAQAPDAEAQRLLQDFFTAVDAGDAAGTDARLASDFVAIDGRGGVRTRAEYLSDLEASARRRASADDLRRDWTGVRVVQRGAGVLCIGRSTWRPAREDGRQPVVSTLVTQDWVRTGDRWQLVRMQTTLLGPPPDTVSYRSGALTLQAMVFRPNGPGPFPAIVYAHGNEPDPSTLFETVGPPLAQRGYLVFAPHRRGAGLSAGTTPPLLRLLTDVERREGAAARARVALEHLEGPHLDDMAAAIATAKQRPDVRPDQVYMIGNSFGGVLVLLAAERELGLAGAADFAGAALNWDGSELFRTRLTTAARNARIPLFLGQAANDASVGPTREIGRVLCAAGKTARAKIWPAYGVTSGDGHAFGIEAVPLWADEVLDFLRAPTPPRADDCAALTR